MIDEEPPLRRQYPYGVHAALCRILDVSASGPLSPLLAHEYRSRLRDKDTIGAIPVSFLAVPPRAPDTL